MSQGKFDWKSFNTLVDSATGLQPYMLQSIIKRIYSSMVFFDNPEQGRVLMLKTSVEELVEVMKAQSEARRKARGE